MMRALLLAVAIGVGVALPSQAAPGVAQVKDIRFEPLENALYLPIEGARSRLVTIASHGKSVVIDIPSTGFPYAEWYDKIERSPLIRALVAAYDPQINGLHLVIEGTVPLTAEPDLAAGPEVMRFLLTPKDRHLNLVPIRPQDVIQRITTIPREDVPPRAEAVTPPSARWALPALRMGFTTGPTSEQYSPEALSASAQSAGRFSAQWEPSVAGYGFPLRVGRGSYRYDDPDYSGVHHLRTETSLDLALSRRYALGPVSAGSAIGYMASLTQVLSSAKPAATTLLFASYQVLHGPSLQQTFAGPVWGPLGLGLELGWTPYVFAHVDGGTRMPWLTTLRVEPKLTLLPDERVSLGYFYERTVGTSFNRESSGLSVGMSFSGF